MGTGLRRCDERLERVFSRELTGCLHRLHVGFPLFRSPSRSHGRQQLFPLRSLLPAYFSSTSAGAIVGRRSELTRKMRGSFTPSVFQPRWTSVPLTVYPYLPRAAVAMTSTKAYLDLLAGASS